MASLRILCLNPGSSSIKAKLFESDSNRLVAIESWKQPVEEKTAFAEALRKILAEANKNRAVDRIGCRIVDGGPDLRATCEATDEIVGKLEQAAELAPLHSGEGLKIIQVVKKEHPQVPLILAFDSGFHQSIPEIAASYPLPISITERHHLKRLGFHGLAYQSAVELLRGRGVLPKRLLAVHLGSGSSASAIVDGLSVDTTMGFTPLEGLMMGTRSGSIDPGILLYLILSGMSGEDLSKTLNSESGLKGVSGTTGDVQKLERQSEGGDHLAAKALEMFSFSAAKNLAALAASMGGADGVCFSGGIGEHSAIIRQRVCERLAFMGFYLDPKLNDSLTKSDVSPISSGGSPVWVVTVDEERQICREVLGYASRKS